MRLAKAVKQGKCRSNKVAKSQRKITDFPALVAKPAPFLNEASSSGMSFLWASKSTNLTMSRHFCKA